MQVESAEYALGVGAVAGRRLQALHEDLLPSTIALFHDAGIQQGMCVADIGCGVGTVSQLLAEIVGPNGKVVGVDRSHEQVLHASKIFGSDHPNLQFVVATAESTGLAAASFDLVYCRFLLIHLADSRAGLAEMMRILKPRGILVCEDAEISSGCSHPPTAINRFAELLPELGRRLGSNWDLGKELYQLVRDSGFHDVNVRVSQSAHTSGDGKRIMEWTVIEAGASLISQGLVDEKELEQVIKEMQWAANDEHVVVLLPKVFHVWGRKPN